MAAGRTREGRGGKEKEEGEDRLGPAVTKYPGSRGRNKSKIVSSMGYGSKKGKEGGRKSRYLEIDTTDVVSQRPIPLNRLISLAAKIPIVAHPHNWLLPRVIVLAPRKLVPVEKPVDQLPSFRCSLSLSSLLRKLFLRGFIPPRRALFRLPPTSLPSLYGFIPLDFRSNDVHSSLYILKYRDGEIVLK